MPSLVLDLAMLVLTIRRVLKISREPHAEPLLLIILRDGIWAVFLTWSKSFAPLIDLVIDFLFSVTVMAALIMSLTGRLHIAIIIAKYISPLLARLSVAHMSYIFGSWFPAMTSFIVRI
jgi:hypothetical protein